MTSQLSVADAYAKARREARAWCAKNDAPPGIVRDLSAALAVAFARHGSKIDAVTIETIGREVLKKHVNAEIARHDRARGV